MGFTIEFGSNSNNRWSETPSKDWGPNNLVHGWPEDNRPHPSAEDENPYEDFRITTDKLEEFGEAIDKFVSESRMIEYHWDRVWIDRRQHEIGTFPLRENGRWVKYGRVYWKDMSIELERKKEMEARKRKRAKQKKNEDQIQKLKDQIKKLGG